MPESICFFPEVELPVPSSTFSCLEASCSVPPSSKWNQSRAEPGQDRGGELEKMSSVWRPALVARVTLVAITRFCGSLTNLKIFSRHGHQVITFAGRQRELAGAQREGARAFADACSLCFCAKGSRPHVFAQGIHTPVGLRSRKNKTQKQEPRIRLTSMLSRDLLKLDLLAFDFIQ